MRHPIVAAAVALLAFLTMLLPSYGHGTVDQHVDSGFGNNLALNYPSSGRLAQGFTPVKDTLTGVDIFLTRAGGGILTDSTIAVDIEEITSGNVLATSNVIIPAGTTNVSDSPYVAHVDFATPLTLTPGTAYRIVVARDATYSWAYGLSNPYPGGTAYVGSSADSSFDFGFRTYYGGSIKVIDTTPPSSHTISHRPLLMAQTAGIEATSRLRGSLQTRNHLPR